MTDHDADHGAVVVGVAFEGAEGVLELFQVAPAANGTQTVMATIRTSMTRQKYHQN